MKGCKLLIEKNCLRGWKRPPEGADFIQKLGFEDVANIVIDLGK